MANPLEITFEPKISTERYIKRNDRVSSFGACALNIANEIYLFGGAKNPFQISKLNGDIFQYLPTSLPIPVFYSLCTQPVNNTPIICGNENDDDRKSCFNFEDVLFGEISESTTKSHSNAISTHFNDSILLISVHSIEILSGQRWNSLPLIPVSEDMVNFASAITMVNQIIVFGGSFANSSPSSSVFRYRFHLKKNGKGCKSSSSQDQIIVLFSSSQM